MICQQAFTVSGKTANHLANKYACEYKRGGTWNSHLYCSLQTARSRKFLSVLLRLWKMWQKSSVRSCSASQLCGPFYSGGRGGICGGRQSLPLKGWTGFLIEPNTVTFYHADPDNPWTYVWVGFSGPARRNICIIWDITTIIWCSRAGRVNESGNWYLGCCATIKTALKMNFIFTDFCMNFFSFLADGTFYMLIFYGLNGTSIMESC